MTGGVVTSGALDTLLAGTVSAAANVTLGPVADLRDGKVRLHVPPGFQYRSFHDTDGSPVELDDRTVLPRRHDGMGCFPGTNGNLWLVRNPSVASLAGERRDEARELLSSTVPTGSSSA